MKYSKYSVIIIGSGISGLYLANKLSESSSFQDGILIVTKENLFSGSSSLAQGGIVSVIPELNKQDSIESHIKDTLKAGCGLNNINTVKVVSENSATVAQELIRFGVEFDKDDKNILNFTLEGAHSCPRILHSQGDSTGRVIEETLCDRIKNAKNVELYDKTMALELLVDETKTCKGIIVFNYQYGEYEAIYSNNIVIATGGIGQIYKNTTNPSESTGDGIALAHKAGADVENMEFVQFHPSALYVKNKTTMPLVSESVRGEGAKLVDLDGNYFAKDYHTLADLAPRDVVARAIVEQCKKTDTEYVNIDISQIGIEKFKQRFPTILSLCKDNNIDVESGLLPVIPAQHYFMGGIKVNLRCETSIKNLYAIGECASSGLHGANRLASNSLLECGVFAHILAKQLIKQDTQPPKKHDERIKDTIDKYINREINTNDEFEKTNTLFQKLKNTMTQNTGIIRTQNSLQKALDDINEIEFELRKINLSDSKNLYELKNALYCAKLITTAALNRKNSIGAHYRADYPHKALIDNKKETINYEEILA